MHDHYPLAVFVLGEFNVHNEPLLMFSGMSNSAGRRTECFALCHDLEQLDPGAYRGSWYPDSPLQSIRHILKHCATWLKHWCHSVSRIICRLPGDDINFCRLQNARRETEEKSVKVWHYRWADCFGLRANFQLLCLSETGGLQ